MKKIKLERMGNTLQWIYCLLVVLMVGFLLFVAFFQNVDVFQTRQTSEIRMVEAYEYQEIADSQTPIGMRREYKWKLDQIWQGENCLAFYVAHHYAQVFIDDELVYQLMPREDTMIGKTSANNWVIVPLYAEDVGKEITVELFPVYENVQQRETTFFIGSQRQIYERALQNDLPQLLLSVLAIGVGLVFLGVSIVERFRKKTEDDLFYLGLFSLWIGIWKITDTRFSPLLFPQNTLVLSYLSLGMLLLVGVPLMLFIKGQCAPKRYISLGTATLAASLLGLVLTLLQICNIADFKETLLINHGMMVISIVVIIYVVIREWRRERESRKARSMLICFAFCMVGAAGDLAAYYMKGNSSGILMTLSAFLLYIIIMGIASIRELSQRAQTDLHTGLFNKSCCNELLKDTAPQEETAVAVFDLNYLKRINDTYGHEAGDTVISDFATILRNTAPVDDFVGRYGGDEFLMVLKKTEPAEVQYILHEIAEGVKAYNAGEQRVKISYAVGCAFADQQSPSTLHSLFVQADQAMYIDKERCHREMK